MRKEEQMAAEIDCDNCDVKDKCRCASFYGDVHCLLVTDRSHTIPLDLLVMPNQDRTPPNPGSDAALDRGCTCPVLDNGHGRINGGKCPFWITANCPLHTA